MTTWFVTGTDTGVGKTEVTTLLAAAARTAGLDVRAIKGLETGVNSTSGPTDAARLAEAAGHAPLCAQTWRTPASPQRAAELEEQPLDRHRLQALLENPGGAFALVEGAGGWTVPLDDALRWDHLVGQTRHPVVVVAANRLGVLNHTLLTCEAIRARGNPLLGVVLNEAFAPIENESAARAGNLNDLRHWLDVPVLPLPFLTTGAARTEHGRRLFDALRRCSPID